MNVLIAILCSAATFGGKPASRAVRPPVAVGPLDAARRAIFWSSPEDIVPKRRTMPVHYWAGNEPALHVYYRHLKGLGGGYVGVGTDQGLLMLEWMKARLAWLIDYDPHVVVTLKIHLAFIRDAKTPRAYLARWAARARRRSIAFVRKTFGADKNLAEIVRIFQVARNEVYWRYVRVRNAVRRAGVPSFLTRQDRYNYLRQMVLAGRIRPMLTNLLDARGMVGIGRAAKKLGVPIRVLYLSNAEHYWKQYPSQYRTNIRAMHFDRRSLVLRTFGLGGKRRYAYQVQPASNFLSWLALPSTTRVHHIKMRRIYRKDGIKFYKADFPPRSRRRPRTRGK